jgi:Tol biopolymer transport system component
LFAAPRGRRKSARAADAAASSTSLPLAAAGSAGSGAPSPPRPGLHRRLALLVGAVLALAAVLGAATAIAAAPVVTAPSASSVRYTTAHLEGEVNPEDHETSYHFEYVTAARFAASEWAEASANGFGSLPEGAGSTPVEADIGGLAPGATYHLRLVAENSEGERVAAVAAQTFATEGLTAPSVTIEAAGSLTPSGTVHLTGSVDPQAPSGALDAATEAAYRTEWRFQCEPGCGGNLSGAVEADSTSHEFPAAPVTVEGEASGLAPNQTYTVKLVASNAGGQVEASESGSGPVEFTTPPIKATIEESPTFDPSQTTATLAARVQLNNAPLTGCHFVYGAGAPSGSEAPCEPLPSAAGVLEVAKVSGLAPGTEYSYRLLATNAAGTEMDAVQSFRTTEPVPPQTCPNESVRAQQHATALPGCRAYEQVSPAEKGSGDIVGDGETNIAAADGEAITFDSRTSFGDTVGSGVSGHTTFLARRRASGWTAHAIDPTPNPASIQTSIDETWVPLFSEDLGHALVWAYDLPGVEGDTPDRKNIYLEDTASRALEPITAFHRPGERLCTNGLVPPQCDYLPYFLLEFLVPEAGNFSGLSADGEHVLFSTGAALLPEDENGARDLYEWDHGALRLADYLPDGSLPSAGAEGASSQIYRGGISADGSRALFRSAGSGGNPQLYMRIDHHRTDLVTESENPSFAGEAEGVTLEYMTPDGKNVFFTTSSPLLSEDTNAGVALYRWTAGPEPEHESNLTLISQVEQLSPPAPGGSLGASFIGSSADGQVAYFATSSAKLFVWDHGISKMISNDVFAASNRSLSPAATASEPGSGRVSPNGRWLAFISNVTLNADGNLGLTGRFIHDPTTGEGLFEIYLYDLRENTLTCASCPSGSAAANVTVTPSVTKQQVTLAFQGIRPRFLADDGTVFFSSPEKLVPGDVNGVADTYQYDPAVGKPQLISTGGGKAPAMFTDASPSGHDVFFVTRQQLVGSDTDSLVDLYDARTDGGFAELPPSPPPCVGDSCRPPASSSPAALAPGSVTAGPGNPRRLGHPRRRHHRRHGHHRRGTSRRSANRNRRAPK